MVISYCLQTVVSALFLGHGGIFVLSAAYPAMSGTCWKVPTSGILGSILNEVSFTHFQTRHNGYRSVSQPLFSWQWRREIHYQRIWTKWWEAGLWGRGSRYTHLWGPPEHSYIFSTFLIKWAHLSFCLLLGSTGYQISQGGSWPKQKSNFSK